MKFTKIILTFAACFMALSLSAQKVAEKPMPAFNWFKTLDLEWPVQRTDTVTLYVIGDIMSHQRQIDSALRNGDPDYSTVFLHISDELAKADIAIGNMEFTMAGKPYSGYPCFSAPDAYAQYLRDIGFDVLLTANNHILDKGYPGLDRTFSVLDTLKGVQFTGMSRNSQENKERYPLILEVCDIKIAILNFTYGVNNAPSRDWPKINLIDRKDILQAIGRAKEAEADIIIAFPHWGLEYKYIHNKSQEDLAKFLVENGVNAVIGAHSHCVQDMQWIDGVPVFYSLGDAISNMDRPEARLGLAVTLKIALKSGEKPRILPPTFEYLWNSKPGEVEESYSALPVRKFLAMPEKWQRKDVYELMKSAYEKTRTETRLHEEDTETGSR